MKRLASLSEDLFEHLYFVGVGPGLGTDNAVDYSVAVLVEKSVPLGVAAQVPGVANDDEAVLGPRDGHVDAVVLLDEVAWVGPHHAHEHDVELSSLRAVDGNDLVLHVASEELLGDGVFLSVVGRDDADAALLELLDRNGIFFLVQPLGKLELAEAKLSHLVCSFGLLVIDERSALELFFAIDYVDEEEWLV